MFPLCKTRLVYALPFVTAGVLIYVTKCNDKGYVRFPFHILDKMRVTIPPIAKSRIKIHKNQELNVNVSVLTTSPKEERKSILIVTYMRSGSTFTADILQQSPDVFYLYEPFKTFNLMFVTSKRICYGQSGICRFSPGRTGKLMNDTMNIFNCNIKHVERKVIKRLKFTPNTSKQHAFFFKCLKRNNEAKCLDFLETQCKERTTSMIKTIRLTLDFALKLLERMKSLKIIHLIRDPRGALESRRHGGYIKLSNITDAAARLCQRIVFDMDTAKTIETNFPGQLLTIYYEELAANPLFVTDLLYNFTGLNLTPEIKQYVSSITKGKANNGYFKTIRTDSSKVAMKWKHSLPLRYIRAIDKQCKDLYEITPYKSIPSKNVRRAS